VAFTHLPFILPPSESSAVNRKILLAPGLIWQELILKFFSSIGCLSFWSFRKLVMKTSLFYVYVWTLPSRHSLNV
jgi:hypothetical protein